MKKNNMVVLIMTASLAAIAGFLIAKKQYEPSATSIVIESMNTAFYTPTGVDNAHLMSARFRNLSGFCPLPATCPGYAQAGLFEFSATSLYDMVSAVNVIKNRVSSAGNPVPPFYRAIFGIDATNTVRIIVAGLNAAGAEYDGSLQIIDGRIPCPTMCDINLSSIIMGPGTTRNACR